MTISEYTDATKPMVWSLGTGEALALVDEALERVAELESIVMRAAELPHETDEYDGRCLVDCLTCAARVALGKEAQP